MGGIMIDSLDYLHNGLNELKKLAMGEYGETLETILSSPDVALTFRRVGRLTSVWYKAPFAESFPYDPNIPTNWARACRCWEIHHQPSFDLITQFSNRVAFLQAVSDELQRPVEVLFEFNLFLSICKGLKPIICKKEEILERAEKVAKDLQKQGGLVWFPTIDQVIGTVSLEVARYFVQSSTWLKPCHVPVVTAFTLLVVCYGHNRLCQLLTNFIASNDPKKDQFAGHDFPRCGSTHTQDGSPCRNRVIRQGLRCWIHIR
jgi:hypothetical protein